MAYDGKIMRLALQEFEKDKNAREAELRDRREREIQAGMCLYCPSGESHSLQNTSQEDLRFFATVVRQ